MSKRWTIRIVSFEGVIRLVTQLSVKRKLAWESKQSFKGNYVTSRLLVQKQSKNNICTSSHGGILQDHPVVDESDVLWRILAAWSFTSQQMKNSCGKDSVFTVFNELTQMAQSCQVKKFCHFSVTFIHVIAERGWENTSFEKKNLSVVQQCTKHIQKREEGMKKKSLHRLKTL